MNEYNFHTTKGTIRIKAPRLDKAVKILSSNYPDSKFTSWHYQVLSNNLYSSRILSSSYLKQIGLVET